MDLFELIKYRRSIRKYQDKQIDRNKLEQIIEAGLYAPTPAAGSGLLFAPCIIKNFARR